MIRPITEKNLKNHLGRAMYVEREGIKGNLYCDGKIKEGELFGILCRDESGFYMKMFKTHWGEQGIVLSKKEFFEEVYRLQKGDIIRLRAGERIVRLSGLETK